MDALCVGCNCLLESLQKHYLVPKHEVVPPEKAKEILDKYGSSTDNFPQMLRDDPVVLEIGAKKGDIIRTIRNSPTAGKAIYYRIVV